jgi:hypothetical protein
MRRFVAPFLLAIAVATTASAAEPKTFYVTIPPLKTDTAKAASEIQRMLKRKPKEVTVVESPEAAEYTVEVLTVTKKNVGEQHNAVIPGQTNSIQAMVVSAKLCAPAKNFCDTVDGDSSSQAIQIGSLEHAAREVYEKVMKAVK